MMNPASLMKFMSAKNQFEKNHPKFASFFGQIIRRGIEVDSVIEITITDPSGNPITANMRVTESDLELVNQLKDLAK